MSKNDAPEPFVPVSPPLINGGLYRAIQPNGQPEEGSVQGARINFSGKWEGTLYRHAKAPTQVGDTDLSRWELYALPNLKGAEAKAVYDRLTAAGYPDGIPARGKLYGSDAQVRAAQENLERLKRGAGSARV